MSVSPLRAGLAVLAAALLVPAALQSRMAAQSAATGAPEAAAIKSLSWRSIGPTNQAGRVSVVVGVPVDPSTWYVAGANGGIFKTSNGGTTFQAIFDDQPVLSIGAVAVAPSDPNVLYVGTGEGNPRNNASFGNGIYKSTDAGAHWAYLGLEDTDKIARIVIDAKNPDIAYVAALGHEWGPNEQRGLFKTSDGGKTWKKVLYKNDLTGCSDVDIHPGNSNIVYAGMYTFRRWAWHLESGGGETAVYKSVDGGVTWTKLTNGLPRGPMDRIGLAVSRSSPQVVYVISETTDEGELWRTDNGGDSWRVVNRDPNINFRPFYYSDIRVDPSDPNTVYALAGGLSKSEDGGRTFDRIGNGVHGDHQALWIDPQDHRRILSGSDGGFQVSSDAGRTFEVINTIAFTQFYHVNYDMQKPYMVCGGLQDNGSWCGPSNSLAREGIRKRDWYTVGGGDGFFAVPDLSKPWLVYNDLQGGSISLTDTRSGVSRGIDPYPNRIGSVGDAMENHKYRFNWNSPIALSPQDPKTVYFGGNVLFRTTNYGMSWEVISPDVTTNDKSKQKSSGGPIVVDNTAAEFHCTILAIAPSPVDPNVIWVGTDDGNVQVTRDGGKTWTNTIANAQGLAPNAWIPTVEASHFDAGTAYFVADHHQDNDYAPYAYKTTDYGKTWKAVMGTGLPAKGWTHVIREDPVNKNLLYLGTELGVYASWDSGARWVDIRNGLPPAPVRDIQIHPREHDIILGTHGRGAYILDDATPLQHLAEAVSAGTQVFDVRPATRWVSWGKDGSLGNKDFAGDNPTPGAYINYYTKTAPQRVAITIVDGAGKTVREIRNAPRNAGVNRAIWDLNFDGQQPAGGGRAGGAPGGEQAAEAPARGRGGRGGGAGPGVLPGSYTAKINIDGREFTKPIRVSLDPRVEVSTADLQTQIDASFQMMQLTQRVNTIVERVDSLASQLDTLEQQLNSAATPRSTSPGTVGQSATGQAAANDPLPVVRSARSALKKFRDEELARPLPGFGYRQYPRLREEVQSVSGSVTRAWTRPTAGEVLRMKELQQETSDAAAKLNAMINGDIAKINQMMSATPRIVGEVIK